MTTNRSDNMGRFSVELDLANHRDEVKAEEGLVRTDEVRRIRLQGVVDTGASRLVLPALVVKQLGLPEVQQITVRYADGRCEVKPMVGEVRLGIQNRSSVFTAVVESDRANALVGAIVLEELDFVADCISQLLVPRDPHTIFAELE